MRNFLKDQIFFMILELFKLLKQESAKFIKNPKAILVLIILPIIFTFIIGGVYVKTFLFDIPLVVLDNDNSSLSRTIVGEFEDNHYFKVAAHLQSYDVMEEAIQSRKAYAALVIPHNFGEDIKEGKAPKTLFIVDGTNLIIGNNALARGAEILNTLNAGVQIKMLQAEGMVPALARKSVQSMSFVDRILYDPQMGYICYLLIGVLGIFVQQTYLAVLVPELVEERNELAARGGITRIGIKVFIKGVISFLTFGICLYFAHRVFYLPIRGSLLNISLLVAVFIINLTVPALIIAALTRDVLKGSQICMFLSVPTILTAGYVWPEYMMPGLLKMGVKLIWPLIYYAAPARDVLVKGVSLQVISPYVWQGILYGIIWMPIGLFIYQKRMQVKQE